MARKKYPVTTENKAIYRNRYYDRFPEARIKMSIEGRSRERGLEFNLTREDIREMLKVTVCPILGIPLFHSKGAHSHNSPSVDRIDNSKGYVKGNCRVISNRANNLKKDATAAELVAIALDTVKIEMENNNEKI
jgi:hypothetical protein